MPQRTKTAICVNHSYLLLVECFCSRRTIAIKLTPHSATLHSVPTPAESLAQLQTQGFSSFNNFFFCVCVCFLSFLLFHLGMSIVLTVAEGEVFVNDAEIQKSALQVIINCVCAPDKRISSIGKFIAGTPRRRLPQQTKASENVLTKMWNVVQSNNGIKVAFKCHKE